MKRIAICLFLPLALFACGDENLDPQEQDISGEGEGEGEVNNERSHSKDTAPDFDEVFNQSAVKRIDIVIPQGSWQDMLDDMDANFSGGGGGPGGGPGGGGPGGGGQNVSDENPITVDAEILYADKIWEHVGVRFKGNSSLSSVWRTGNRKLSFKLDFDEYEDAFPETEDQRFFGFKKLSLKNNFDDTSFMREVLMADLFRDAGLAMSHTSFYEVHVNYGEGAEYFGLYTLVEEVDDTLIETQFDSDEGNVYKPDGDGATFAVYDEDSLVKKTNEDEADFSDVSDFYDSLHSSDRFNDPEAWREALDEVFDTEVFLKYLALNTLAQNWDTYGRMTHNYYLYNDPTTQKLTWIPWDNNEALSAGKRGGSLEFDFASLDDETWPIISYLYEDEVYRAQYDGYLELYANGIFSAETMDARVDAYAELIEPYALSEVTGSTFLRSDADYFSGVAGIKTHVRSRQSAYDAYAGQ